MSSQSCAENPSDEGTLLVKSLQAGKCEFDVVCSKPGMFYFQSVTADKDKMLSCVVLVRERQRSVVVSLLYSTRKMSAASLITKFE